jgi:MFS transporter, DHA3 family, macrolide efflux protein
MVQTGGIGTFLVIWAGQLVSTLGSSMTRFALAIWVWERTGAATATVLTIAIALVASLLANLAAGPLVDRWSRKRVMIFSDLIAGLSSCAVLVLVAAGRLEVWHLYVVAALSGALGVFQGLAFSASTTLLVPESQYARARGLLSLSEYASMIGAPLLAGVLLGSIGLVGILVIDIVTFLFAVSVLLVLHVPQPEAAEPEEPRPLWRETVAGYQYIWARRGLLGLMLIAFTFSLAEALGWPLVTPLIMARTGDEAILGLVRAVQGIGGIAGGVALSIWGGPKRRIHAVLIGMMLTGLLGDALIGIAQSLPVWLLGAFFLELFIPIVLGAYFAIWQAQVAPEMQGRVFAARNFITTLGEPASMLLGGILSDTLLEPAMRPGEPLARMFGGLVGTGSGAGMALLLVIGGVLTVLVGLSGYLFRSVREVEAMSDAQCQVEPAPAQV